MANEREIKTRMKSIQDTMKITNAMYMISSAKLRKARENLENTEPYFLVLQETITRILRNLPETEHPYLEEENGYEKINKKKGYIVITADKGLAGAYNHNVVKLTEQCLNAGENNQLFVVGELGREYFIQHKVPIRMQFHYTVQDPDLTRARDISDYVISLYKEKKLDEIYVIYTRMINSMSEEARIERLLPLKRSVFATAMLSDVYAEDIRMVPSVNEVVNNVVPDYIAGFIYGALVESFCSEQNARMMAMKAATDNAENILKELHIAYHRVRQGAITQEVTEVIAGARAQKKRRKNVK